MHTYVRGRKSEAHTGSSSSDSYFLFSFSIAKTQDSAVGASSRATAEEGAEKTRRIVLERAPSVAADADAAGQTARS